MVSLLRGLNALRNASAGLVVPSCELAVARVYGRVPSSRAGMLTLSTVRPEPGLREQPPSLCTGREGDQGQTRLFAYAPPPCEKATQGRMKKVESVLDLLSFCADARGLLSQTRLWPNR